MRSASKSGCTCPPLTLKGCRPYGDFVRLSHTRAAPTAQDLQPVNARLVRHGLSLADAHQLVTENKQQRIVYDFETTDIRVQAGCSITTKATRHGTAITTTRRGFTDNTASNKRDMNWDQILLS